MSRFFSSLCVAGAFAAWALDDPDKEHHDRHNHQDVDESPHRKGRDQSERPQQEENNGDGPQHGFTSFGLVRFGYG
jgi:hypothetical protein